MSATTARIGSIVLDCPDPEALADFYSQLLGWPRDPADSDDGWIELANPDGGVGLSFQRADNYRTPTWPDPEVQQQLHLDLGVEDLDAAQARALELGARLLDDQGLKQTGFRVYADPAGHPFCLCRN